MSEDLELEWTKAGFTKADIEEMDKRWYEPTVLFLEFLKEIGYGDIIDTYET